MTFTAEIAAPALKDLKTQAPWAICEMLPTNTQANLLVNRDKPPFDNADLVARRPFHRDETLGLWVAASAAGSLPERPAEPAELEPAGK